MAKKKAAKQERELQEFSDGQPIETVEANEPIPFVQPATAVDEKTEAIKALRAEVEVIAAGRPLESVVYRFNKRNGTQTGSSLKYYMACKTHEIENGVPCDFVSPAGPPQEILSVSISSTITPSKAKPKCPTC